MQTSTTAASFGDLLRGWRRRRRLSQLALALEADVSARHVSFLETGRARPSREMLLRLADHLDVPARDRNTLLTAAGFAQVYPQRSLDDPALAAARSAVDLVLRGHEPSPALAVDRHWTLVAANRAVAPLLTGVDAALVQPPINVLRLSLHPNGLAPRIVNLVEWRTSLLDRLRRQVERSADPALAALLDELVAYPTPATGGPANDEDYSGTSPIAIPLRLQTELGLLSFISTTTVFGTPVDVTLDELAIESFFPSDRQTAAVLRRIADDVSHDPGEEG